MYVRGNEEEDTYRCHSTDKSGGWAGVGADQEGQNRQGYWQEPVCVGVGVGVGVCMCVCVCVCVCIIYIVCVHTYHSYVSLFVCWCVCACIGYWQEPASRRNSPSPHPGYGRAGAGIRNILFQYTSNETQYPEIFAIFAKREC